MTAEEARRIDDQIQEEMVAQQNADVAEVNELGDLLLILLGFVVVILVLVGTAAAAFATGNDPWFWALLAFITVVGLWSAWQHKRSAGAL